MSIKLLLCLTWVVIIRGACVSKIQADSTLLGNTLASSTKESAQACFDWCCTTTGCSASAWVYDTKGCYLKDSATVSSTAVTAESGTQVWKVVTSTATCTYDTYSGQTVFGADMAGSGNSYANDQACADLCCQTTDCKAAARLSSWGGCYIKSSATYAGQTRTTQAGTNLLVVKTRTVTTAVPQAVSCKKGVAYGGWGASGTANDFSVLMKNQAWYYNWAINPDTISSTANKNFFADKVEFVPMLWGEASVASINSIPTAKYLLGFNEPNFVHQSNMQPKRAAELWSTIQNSPKTTNMKLVSPAVNFCGGAGNCITENPVNWLKQFFGNCTTLYGSTGCRVDYIAMHSYTCKTVYLSQHIEMYKAAFPGKQIWLTEFSCGDIVNQPPALQASYISEAIQYLDSEPSIFRYAWFAGRSTEIPTTNLLAAVGVLSKVGVQYTTQAQCPTIAAAISDSTAMSQNSDSPRPIDGGIIAIIVVPLSVFFIIGVVLFVRSRKVAREENV